MSLNNPTSHQGWHLIQCPKDSTFRKTFEATVRTAWLRIPGTDREVKFCFQRTASGFRLTHYGSGAIVWRNLAGPPSALRTQAEDALQHLVARYGAPEVLRRLRAAPQINEPHRERPARQEPQNEAAGS